MFIDTKSSDLVKNRGETINIRVTAVDENGAAYNNIDYAIFKLKKRAWVGAVESSPWTQSFDCVVDGNLVSIDVPESITLSMIEGTYDWEIRAHTTTNMVHTLRSGTIKLNNGVINTEITPT